MVPWYGVGCIIWLNFPGGIYVAVYNVRNGRLRRRNIISNDLIHRLLQSVRKYKPCGQTDRQVCITKTETQFYKVRIALHVASARHLVPDRLTAMLQ